MYSICTYMCICIYTHYSTLKSSEILKYAMMWMNLEDIMLYKISQTQKNKYYMSLPI